MGTSGDAGIPAGRAGRQWYRTTAARPDYHWGLVNQPRASTRPRPNCWNT